MKKLTLTILLIFCLSYVYSQNYCFSRNNNIDLKGGYLGFAYWCDINSDSKLDIFVTGLDFGGDFQHAMLYKNNRDNTFSETNIKNIPRVIYGSLSWGDYDNDGNIDLLYSGTKSGMSEDNITKIYRNDGIGNFLEITSTLAQVGEGDVDWIDMDNDGKLDIFLMGINDKNIFEIGVYRNLGNDTFVKKIIDFKQIAGGRGNFSKCEAEWADFDNDGLKDVIIAMSTATNFDFKFYKNLGDFKFKEVNIGLPKLNYVSMAVGDINQDGLIDFVFSGSYNQSLYSAEYNDIKVFINKGNLSFENSYTVSNNGVFWNNMELADYNNDGYPDILYFGNWQNKQLSVFKNNKNNTFSYAYQNILDCSEGGGLFGDFNNDNSLDILYYGRIFSPTEQEVTYIYQNTLSPVNSRPSPPTDLQATVFNNDIHFSWNAGNDDSTKVNGLYYNIRIGTKTNPDSLVSGNSTNEKLKYNFLGNVNKNTWFDLKNVPEGRFVMNVQSIDNSYNVSKFSDTLEFCLKHSKNLFRDTTICYGDSVKLDCGDSFKSYEWNTSQQSRVIYAKKEGSYFVRLIDHENCMSVDSVLIKVNDLSVYAGADKTIICEGEAKFDKPIVSYYGLGPLSYSWLPVDGLDNANIASPTAGVKTNTIYSLSVISPEGCEARDTVKVFIYPISLDAGANKTIVCGDSVQFDKSISNYTGTDSLTYSWFPSEGLNATNTDMPFAKVNNTTTFTLTVATPSGCLAKDSVIVTVNPLTAIADDVNVSCGNKAQLYVKTNYTGLDSLIYLWTPSVGLSASNIPNPEVTLQSKVTYSVEIKTKNRCVASDSATVSTSVISLNPSICMVTVNENEKNVIVWQNEQNLVIDSFLIYRESFTKAGYDVFGKVPYSAGELFIDTSSDARIQSNKYKVAIKDICGFITDKSQEHKTIHLRISKGNDNVWNLEWEPYVGTTVLNYKVYRGTSRSNLAMINTNFGNDTTYTDEAAPVGDVYYQIEVEFSQPCSGVKSTGLKNPRSNIIHIAEVATGIFSKSESDIFVYPNPASGKLFIKNIYSQGSSIMIINMQGKLLLYEPIIQDYLDISSLSKGIYTVKLIDSGTVSTNKLIIE